jgi:hypothetical protein
MRRAPAAAFGIALLIVSAHRSPAPIQEAPESPTPALADAAIAEPKKSPPKPKAKPSAEPPRKPQTKTTTTPSQTGAARFAGTWIGRIAADRMGDVDVRLVISTDGISVAQTSKAGVWTRPLTYDGKILSWQTGPTNAVAWTLKLNPDEQSALVTRNWSRNESRAIFTRVRSTSTPR